MLEIFWISEEGWGKRKEGRPLPDDVKIVSEAEYLKHEAVELVKLESLPEPVVKKKAPAKKAATKKTAGRKKVAAPKKDEADGS